MTGCGIFFQFPDKHVVSGAQQTIKTEMNRRPKLLTIEGIQKRKNPDKNYVSKIIVVLN